MNMARLWFRPGSLLCLLTAIVAMSFVSYSAFGQSKPSGDRIQQIDRMIDAMASRNKAPEMVYVRGYNEKAPLVSRDYDWSEQERVQKAIRAVQNDKSDEMWRRLSAHYGDKRYTMTLVFDTVVNSKNISVGDICAAMPGPDYDAAYIQYLPKVSGRYYFNPASIVAGEKWAGRPLYEQQIAVCEEAIKQMALLKATEAVPFNDYRAGEKAHVFTTEEKAKFTEEVTRQIEVLKRTKQPVYGAEKPLSIYSSAWEPFDAQDAKNVREAYEKEKSKRPKDEK
jgi:hypothetical protein